MNIKLVCKTLALPVMTLFGSSAMAVVNDAKTYPGSTCQPISNTAVFSVDSIGRISNPSATATLTVDCPIVRDVMAANATDGVDVGWIRVQDNNPAAGMAIRCTLFSENKLNNGLTDFGNDASVDGVDQLNYFDLASSFEGYYHYFCTIPPTSGGLRSNIKEYYVGEEGGAP